MADQCAAEEGEVGAGQGDTASPDTIPGRAARTTTPAGAEASSMGVVLSTDEAGVSLALKITMRFLAKIVD